jgi:hypothetical protein
MEEKMSALQAGAAGDEERGHAMSSSLPDYDIGTNLDDLAKVMALRPLALIGAGASVASGYPSWGDLLEALEERIKRSATPNTVSPKLKMVLDKLGDPAWHAEELVRRLGDQAFCQYIQDTFQSPKPPLAVSEVHKALATLGFRHYLTTNYDPCMEEALHQAGRTCCPIYWSDAGQVGSFFGALSDPSAMPCVAYIHGRYDRPSEVVLTETSYRIYLDEIFERRLLAIFMTQPVVFIGFSMTDPELGQLMRVVRATMGSSTTRHFGIFGYRTADERELIQRRMLDKYGVRAVFYRIASDDAGRDDHRFLLDLLGYLRQPAHAAMADGKPAAGAPGQEAHKEVHRSSAPLSFSSSAYESSPAAIDPHKGMFGGSPERNGRVLTVENIDIIEDDAYLGFTLVVKPTEGAPPVKGKVRFRLHPTFAPDDYEEVAKNGAVRSRIPAAYGAFTVGVTADNGQTQLELDLSELDVFPTWFRER